MVNRALTVDGDAAGEGGAANVPPSALLAALSHAFAYPADGLDKTLVALGNLSSEARSGHETRIAHVIASSKRFGSRTEEQLAYTRLFIGSFKMEAPPYASYYLDKDHLMYAQPAVDVKAIYRQFGIDLKETEKMPADHLRYLLAFCSLLARRHEETGEAAFAESYADFRDEFILSWLPECRKLVNRYAEAPYYPELVALIVEVLEENPTVDRDRNE